MVVGQRSGVGSVEIQVGGVDDVIIVVCCIGNCLEDVGVAVPSAEGGETPVHRYRGQGGIMVVKCAVISAFEVGRNSAAQCDGEDIIVLGIGIRFVKCQENEGVVREIGIVQ